MVCRLPELGRIGGRGLGAPPAVDQLAVERERRRRRCAGHAGNGEQPVAHLLHEHRAFARLPCLRRQHERQNLIRVESRVDATQRDETAQHQSRPDEQNERERYFRDDHAMTQLPPAAKTRGTPPNRAQDVHHVSTRRTQRRNEAAQDRRDETGQYREGQHPWIDGDRLEAGQILRSEREQRLDATPRQREPQDRSDDSDDQAFGQHLAHELQPSRADRGAHRQFATASRGTHDEQVRDVRTGDEQDERDGAHQRQDRRPHVADQILEHRDRSEVEARRLFDGKLFAQVRRDAVDERLRLLNGDARLQACDHAERDVVAIGRFEVEAGRGPHIRQPLHVRARREQQLEIRGQHADDLCAAAAEIDVFVDHLRIATVAAHPQRMADDRDCRQSRRRRLTRRELSLVRRLRLRRRVVVDEIASEEHARAEHAEEVRCRAADADLLRFCAGVGNRCATRGDEAGDVVEELPRLLAQVAIVRRRERPVVNVAVTQLAPDRDQPLRVRVRQRAQQDGIDDAED